MEQNLTLYKIFYEVAKAGNISHAAKELFITQPAVSKGIRTLEHNLNIKLFIRTSRGVLLTDEGKLLFQYVNDAMNAISSAESLLHRHAQLGMGHLRIGVSTTLCKYLLMPYLHQFVLQYPHIQISIHCQSSFHTMKLLEEHKLDLGLIAEPESSRPFTFHKIQEIEDIFVASPTYLDNLLLRRGKTIDYLQSATLMLLDRENMSRQYIDDYLKQNQIKASNILEASTMDLLIEFCKIGIGLGCVIKEFVSEELSTGILTQLPLDIPIHKRDVGFAYLKHTSISHALSSFLEVCKISPF